MVCPASPFKQYEADHLHRVEKYRPNSLDDVSGHQDILATINRFIEANVFGHNSSMKFSL
jgi:replication factor C subunit 3/5